LSQVYELELGQRASAVNLGDNLEFASDTVRIVYSSMIIPPQNVGLQREDKIAQFVEGIAYPELRPDSLPNRCLEALSTDGTRIPISFSLEWTGSSH
jgi:protease II